MKKSIWTLIAALGVLSLGACNDDTTETKPDPDPDPITTVIPVESVAFDAEVPSALVIGQEVTIAWTVLPSDATNKDVVLDSSDKTVATITDAGVLKALKVGTTTISVTTVDGAKTDDFELTVATDIVAVTSLTLNYSGTKTAVKDEEFELIATVLPNEATVKTVTWTYDEQVFDIYVPEDGDNAGKTMLKVLKGGSGLIKATTDGKNTAGESLEAEFTVTATSPVKGIKLVDPATGSDISSKTINVGQTIEVEVKFEPEDATNKNYTIDYEGPKVTAVKKTDNPMIIQITGAEKAGEFEFPVSSEEKYTSGEGDSAMEVPHTDYINLKVNQPVTTMTLTGTDETPTFMAGTTYELTVAFADNPTTQTYDVTTGSTTIATASIKGSSTADKFKVVVTGVAAGNTTVTVTSKGKNTQDQPVSATRNIVITAPPVIIQSISLEQSTLNVASRGTKSSAIKVVYNPSDVPNKNVTAVSSNTSIATVAVEDAPTGGGKQIVVTGVKAGSATITVTSSDTSNGTKAVDLPVTVTAAPAVKLGTASFRTQTTWTAGNYIWSDFVTGTVCQKDTYTQVAATDNAATTDENCDCARGAFKNGTDGARYYDVFTAGMIYYYADVLCPAEWRVPTDTEFNALTATFTPTMYTYSQWTTWGAELGGGVLGLNKDSVWDKSGEALKFGGFYLPTQSNAASRLRIWSVVDNPGMDATVNTGGYTTSERQEMVGLRCVKDK